MFSVHINQGLSQDLETGCSKLAIVNFWGILCFKAGYNIHRLQVTSINMYLVIETRHDILSIKNFKKCWCPGCSQS